MNNEQNAQLLSLWSSKNDLFRLCYALLDEDFDNKVYFENNIIKTFLHSFLYHQEKQSSINNTDHPKDNNQNQNEDKNI